ncbi:MAG TPA: hypothetical protein DIC34_04635 [Treponema sp.]|nr:hypothetical protein [Treponema sp.]
MVARVRGITRYGYVIKNSGNFVLGSSIEMGFDLFEAHERTRKSEILQKTLLKTIPDLIWLKDADGVYLTCNHVFELFAGANEAEIIGKTDYDLVGKELADFFREHDRMAMVSGKPTVNEEWVTFASDGRKALLETVKTPMYGGNGDFIGVLGISRDITDRKRAEEQILRQNRIYAVLSDINQAIVRIHEQGALLEEACRIAVKTGEFRMAWIGKADTRTGKVEIVASVGAEDGRISALSFPLTVFGNFWGTFNIYPVETEFSDDTDIRLLEEMAMDISFALEFIESEIERKRAEEDRTAHLRFLESLDRVNVAIQGSTDLDTMMGRVLETMIGVFDSDRAWLLYPCDPEAASFRVPMEVTKPEYPGAKVLNADVPMSPEQAENMREALESAGPVTYTAGTDRPISTAKIFGVQSQIFVPVYPKSGKPWIIGMHQCSHPRIWTPEENRLFQEIARRLGDGLTSLLLNRELRETVAKIREGTEPNPPGEN